jgi:hypothetical protein
MDGMIAGPRTSRLPGPIHGERWRDRTRINANRVRAGWAGFLAGFDWQVAATLTFDPKRAPHHSEANVSREVYSWCGQVVGRLNRRPVGWAYAVEGGGGGWLHAHALLIGCYDSTWDAAVAMWEVRCGRALLKRVYDPVGAAAYLTKSIGSNGEIVLSDTLQHYRRPADATAQ